MIMIGRARHTQFHTPVTAFLGISISSRIIRLIIHIQLISAKAIKANIIGFGINTAYCLISSLMDFSVISLLIGFSVRLAGTDASRRFYRI